MIMEEVVCTTGLKDCLGVASVNPITQSYPKLYFDELHIFPSRRNHVSKILFPDWESTK